MLRAGSLAASTLPRRLAQWRGSGFPPLGALSGSLAHHPTAFGAIQEDHPGTTRTLSVLARLSDSVGSWAWDSPPARQRRWLFRYNARPRKKQKGPARRPPKPLLPHGKTAAELADEDEEEYFMPETPYKSTSSEVLNASFADFPPLEEQKVLQAGLLGVPNAGKSELTNRLVGNKVTAVSSKENTTVNPNLGSFVVGSTQIVLYDLPGVLHPDDCKYVGQLTRIKGAWATASECNYILFLVDSWAHLRYSDQKGDDPRLERIFAKLKIGLDNNGQPQAYPPVILLLNKVDKVDEREKIVELAKYFYGKYPFKKCFFISALKGGGIQYLREYLVRKAEPREWIFPPGVITDKTPVCLALELVREKLYRRMNKELPYKIDIVHEQWKELADGTVLIKQTMYVINDRIRRMVVGKKGEIIQSYIAFRAQRDLIKILRRKVFLSIKVKVVNPLGKLAAQGK